MHYYIHADKFLLLSGLEYGGYLEICDGKFGQYTKEKPTDAEILDYQTKTIAPGLVDTHIHGFKNHDVMDCDLDGLKEISTGLLSCGVTSFLPTTLTSSTESLNEVAKLIGDHYQEVNGAKIQGIFFEGPFFTTEHKGAQNPIYMGDPNYETFENWQNLAGGLIKKIAIAPERKGAVEFTQKLTQEGVHVALGHSSATYEEACQVVFAGADIFVHTYNGMSGLNHREPGMVGAAMDTQETFGELICDGHHVAPAAANALIKVKTPKRIVMITDCMRAGGMPEGDGYFLGEFPVVVKDGAARLKDSGSLAGSILKLITGVKNVVKWGKVSLYDAFKMASYVPAVSVGIQDKCGGIVLGHPADFLVVDDDVNLYETYLNGQSVYQKEN